MYSHSHVILRGYRKLSLLSPLRDGQHEGVWDVRGRIRTAETLAGVIEPRTEKRFSQRILETRKKILASQVCA